jgi:hypothetical protein
MKFITMTALAVAIAVQATAGLAQGYGNSEPTPGAYDNTGRRTQPDQSEQQ